jgi:Zn-dependent protease
MVPSTRPSFTLFGIPVRVTSSFWVMAIVYGTIGFGGQLEPGKAIGKALLVVAIVFASILLHELGHALTARRFGMTPSITLHMMGGLTHFEGGRLSRAQSSLVSFAGPGTGLLVGAIVWLLTARHTLSGDARDVLVTFFWVNIGWSLINLLPVIPFDGGHILSAVLGPKRVLWTTAISATVGVAVALVGWKFGLLFVAILFASAAVSSMRQLRAAWLFRKERVDGIDGELANVKAAMMRGDTKQVLALSEALVNRARTPATKNGALIAMAWAQATEGRTVAAREIIERLQADGHPDLYFLAALEDVLGSAERARALLEAARQQGWRRADTTKLLIDLYARDGQMVRATEVAGEDLESLDAADARAVVTAAMAQRAYRAAAGLSAKIFAKWGDPSDQLQEARAWALAKDPTRLGS